MDIEKTLNYIKKNGTGLDIYRIEYLFYDKRDDTIPLKIFSEVQNEDGGFPHNFEKGNASGVSETSIRLANLSELDLLNSDLGKRIVKYLVSKQKSDGRWSENLEILQYDPPPWDMPNDLKCDMWLTAEMALHMLPLGYREEAKKAAQFLARNRENDRLFGYELTTILGASLFSCLGEETQIKNIEKKAQEIVEEEEEPAFLNWYIRAVGSSHFSFKDDLIERSLKKLQKKLEKSMIFESADGEWWNISHTIESLKLLKKYGKV